MTGESTHTASKERMAPEHRSMARINVSSEQSAPQESNTSFEIAVAITLRFQLCSARYKVLQMKNSRRSASQSSHHENTIRAPQLSITASKYSRHYTLLSAIFSLLHSVTNEE